jgi:hypothetical protein
MDTNGRLGLGEDPSCYCTCSGFDVMTRCARAAGWIRESGFREESGLETQAWDMACMWYSKP